MEMTLLKTTACKKKKKYTNMKETVSAGLFLLMYKQFLLPFCDLVSSLSFPKLFTRGSKYKALQSPHLQDKSGQNRPQVVFSFIH